MADHYISLARGVEGTKDSDFVIDTSSTATALFEFRVLDGVTPTKVEVLKALEGFERYFQNAQQAVASGFDIKG
jgi:hypothetical protein